MSIFDKALQAVEDEETSRRYAYLRRVNDVLRSHYSLDDVTMSVRKHSALVDIDGAVLWVGHRVQRGEWSLIERSMQVRYCHRYGKRIESMADLGQVLSKQ